MLLNSNQISEYIIESEFSKRAQIGIDLSVCKVEQVNAGSEVYLDGIQLHLMKELMFLLIVLLKLHTVHPYSVQEQSSNRLGGIQVFIVTK